MKYTTKDILELDPCEEYTREKLEELWEGKESLTLREILELTIPIVDKNWVIPRLVSVEIVVKWAHLCAHEAKKHADKSAAAAHAAADAARCAATADAANAARSAEYAGYAARYAAADATADRVAYYAANAARSAEYAARSAAVGYARSAAHAAADAGSTWSENRDTELYKLLTILCNMEEESTWKEYNSQESIIRPL